MFDDILTPLIIVALVIVFLPIALLVMLVRLSGRVHRLERELGALRSFTLAQPATAPANVLAQRPEPAAQAETPVEVVEQQDEARDEVIAEAHAQPWTTVSAREPAADAESIQDAPEAAAPAEPATSPRRDLETALGTRWAVWVGGIALALGGLFLVRYTIEAGYFGPAARLTLAAFFGAVLLGASEFIRRTGFRLPVRDAASAYIPSVLAAAGAFTLFGVVYAAHAVYGFIGPALAFGLLGLIGVGTIATSLVHGRALAGVGLLGSLATPMLVDSQSPSVWALFGYLAVVLAATGAIARLRNWSFLLTAAYVGIGLWILLYIGNTVGFSVPAVLFMALVSLAVLLGIWLLRGERYATPGRPDAPSIALAVALSITAVAMFFDGFTASKNGGLVIILAMLGAALYRGRALPLLHGAGVAALLVILQDLAASVIPTIDTLVGSETFSANSAAIFQSGVVLGAAFLAAGFWRAPQLVRTHPLLAANWTAWGVIAPLSIAVMLWLDFGNIDRDAFYAAVTLFLAVAFAAGAEWTARAEEPAQAGGAAVSVAAAGAMAAALFSAYMAFGSGLTTVACGLLAAVPAFATRQRAWPVLGWLSAAAAISVIARIGYDPTIVGADRLSTTPVFNWLLWGYGIPTLAFLFAAWQLRRTTAGRPQLIMEAVTALFSLLTIAMLVRHAMNGGVITSNAPTLAEQAIYTLLALGGGAVMVSLDMRSPSSVLRYGSLGLGVLSAIFIAGQHFLALNPLFTGESTGRIPVFNLLFLAYLLPAVAAGALALYARDKRPRWYSMMLTTMASLLVFFYATLSVRRLFKGEYIGFWAGFEPWETYSYSALWLAMGVALLVAGVRLRSQVLRVASAALIVVSVAKVFLFDMSELEGVLRALSFIGLGAVLIGIGLFYQKLLTKAAR